MIEYQNIETDTICTHCGDKCTGEFPTAGDHSFCCNGCEIIWNLLQENGLADYYDIESLPGISARKRRSLDYSFLEDPSIQDRLISFSVDHSKTIFLDLPQIHCTACVWLLENLNRLDPGVKQSRVNFLNKQCTIVFDDREISLLNLVQLLDKIGYPPTLSFDQLDKAESPFVDRSLIFKIGVAGFCFGNIMLLSFPDYLGFSGDTFANIFGYLNILLALPVILYSGKDYLVSAWQSIRMWTVGIDVPIALGMLTLFLRSVYEIISGAGEGYLDSLSGFLLFLLIGRWFQSRTYKSISFDRDFRSFFPISVKVKEGNNWVSRSIDQLEKGDMILVRNEEIIPCDGYLRSGRSKIDYSFVTGESKPAFSTNGEPVSAGGKQLGGAIEIKVNGRVDQSQLTKLWNDDVFNKRDVEKESIVLNIIGKYFTISILSIAFLTITYWYIVDVNQAFNSFTAVLIIACPCVLALSVPFIYGNTLRLLSKASIYCRNVFTLFDLNEIDTIVFDKTGTITDSEQLSAQFIGTPLTKEESTLIKSLCFYSNHTLSMAITKSLENLPTIPIDQFEELPGKGINGICNGMNIRVGSPKYIFNSNESTEQQSVFIEIDDKLRGHFVFENPFRSHIEDALEKIKAKYNLAVVSGDHSREKSRISAIFPESAEVLFDQSPTDKLNFINRLQRSGRKVMMVGDGLNDAGALKSSDVGVVISTDENNFTPSSDIILSAVSFSSFADLMALAKNLKIALYGAFILALLYNSIGLVFAVSGNLTPIVAAILMPFSSISIMLYGVLVSLIVFKRMNSGK